MIIKNLKLVRDGKAVLRMYSFKCIQQKRRLKTNEPSFQLKKLKNKTKQNSKYLPQSRNTDTIKQKVDINEIESTIEKTQQRQKFSLKIW